MNKEDWQYSHVVIQINYNHSHDLYVDNLREIAMGTGTLSSLTQILETSAVRQDPFFCVYCSSDEVDDGHIFVSCLGKVKRLKLINEAVIIGSYRYRDFEEY